MNDKNAVIPSGGWLRVMLEGDDKGDVHHRGTEEDGGSRKLLIKVKSL
jgi:hypothetical protein